MLYDIKIVEMPKVVKNPLQPGEGMIFRGGAGNLDMKITGVKTEDSKITVTTTGTEQPTTNSEWDNVLEELFDDAAKDMAEKLKGANAPVPDEIGYELTENDEVIAEIEMAWTESKIAYLTEDQMEYEEILTDKGWTIINNDTAVSKDMFGGVN